MYLFILVYTNNIKICTYTNTTTYVIMIIILTITIGNTIQGRQCMASALFLSNKYEEANVYFHSIKEYMFNDDSFYWNYGISLASAGLFEDAAV